MYTECGMIIYPVHYSFSFAHYICMVHSISKLVKRINLYIYIYIASVGV